MVFQTVVLSGRENDIRCFLCFGGTNHHVHRTLDVCASGKVREYYRMVPCEDWLYASRPGAKILSMVVPSVWPCAIPFRSLGLLCILDSADEPSEMNLVQVLGAGCEFGACGAGPMGLTPGQGGPDPVGQMVYQGDLLGLVAWAWQHRHLPYSDPADSNHRLFGTHFCGPGGGGSVGPGVDSACQVHDACYDATGLHVGDNFRTLSPRQSAALNFCNQQLCNSVRQMQGVGPALVDGYFSIVPTKGHACQP